MSEDLEVRARDMGWVPEEEFKGDKAKWKPAEEFVAHGEEILPILKKTNEGLRNDLTQIRGDLTATQAALAESREAIESFKTFHAEEVAERVKAAREKLKAEHAAASAAGDHAAVAELTEEMTRLNAADAAAEKEAKDKAAVDARRVADRKDTTPDPVFVAWAAENADWYGKDIPRTSLVQGIAADLRMKGDKTLGRDFLDKCLAEADRMMNRRPRDSKVSEGNGGEGSMRERNSGGKSFSDLPADAQATARRQAAKLVGPNRAFKTEQEWYANYTKVYLEAEGA